jgi:hypothetical protein
LFNVQTGRRRRNRRKDEGGNGEDDDEGGNAVDKDEGGDVEDEKNEKDHLDQPIQQEKEKDPQMRLLKAVKSLSNLVQGWKA